VQVRKAGGTQGVYVIADESLTKMSNFVTGANDPGYHMINANYPRDFEVTQVANIAEPYDGAGCPKCEGALHIEPAITLGYCRKWGTRFSEPTGATYLDDTGKEQPVLLGSYGLSLDRVVAAMIETHHDEYGILWPPAISPYHVHLVALVKDQTAAQQAEELYADLQAASINTLYDDRGLSPGVMFSDADLMGIPLRLTISKRSLENGGIEVKWRHEKDRFIIPLEDAVSEVGKLLGKV
jgi:prolyl-tRNA synthetase